MQTKTEIQTLLAGIEPKKRLGQNFLIDLNLMRFLIDAADIKNNDVVLEVGCGTGSLTQAIAEKAGFCVVAELDTALAEIAKRQLTDKKNVEIINTDILENKHTISGVILDKIAAARKEYNGRFMLVANLPYNIASPLMANLVTGHAIVDRMFVTVQREVAYRMTAQPGDGLYGTLSILLAATGDLEMIRVLKPTVFWPQPQVESAMVSFVRNRGKADKIRSIELLSEIVNLFMQHRRKMLKACTKFAAGSLANIKNWDEIFNSASIAPTHRPEQIPPKGYVELANHCDRLLKKILTANKL